MFNVIEYQEYVLMVCYKLYSSFKKLVVVYIMNVKVNVFMNKIIGICCLII